MVSHLVGTALATVALALSGNYGTVGDAVEQAGRVATGAVIHQLPPADRNDTSYRMSARRLGAAISTVGASVTVELLHEVAIGTAESVTKGD